MNIAVVVTNLAGSGAEKIALEQAKMFNEHGHNVKLFILEDIISYDISSYNFEIITLTKWKNSFKWLGRIGDWIYSVILQSKFKSLNFYPNVLFSNLPRADRVVKFLNIKKFFIIHMSYKEELNKFSKRRAAKKLRLYKRVYKDENLITVAKEIENDLKYLKIEFKSAKTIYNPFDFDKIRKKAKDKVELDFDYLISPNAFRVQKRYDILLDAFKQIRSNIKLLILAKKDKKLFNMIKERGLENRVIILGFQKNPYPYIKNAKLTLLSSDREGLPTVIIESLILNTPVISTDCPTGPKEILIDDLSKWLVPVGNSLALAKKIEKALDSKIEIKKRYIDRFDKDFIYQEYKGLIDE